MVVCEWMIDYTKMPIRNELFCWKHLLQMTLYAPPVFMHGMKDIISWEMFKSKSMAAMYYKEEK
jgi:hypothetical protein